MKRLTLYSLLTMSLVLLSACGSPAPTAASTAQLQSTAGPVATSANPATPPTTDPGPTALPQVTDGSTKVEVVLADNTVTSTLTTFKAGTPYTFAITNNGRHEHNFVISPPVTVAGGYSEALAQALLALDQTQLPPGTTVTVEYTFPASAVGADLEFNCLIRRHYEDGMRLAIKVTA